MRDFDNFGKDFRKEHKSIMRFSLAVIVVALILKLAVLAGVGYVVYLLLRHFGIV